MPLARHPRRLLARILLAAALAPAVAGAQGAPPPATGIVSGRVVAASTEEPIAAAAVLVRGTAIAAQTDEAGRFTLRGVPVGVRAVEVRRLGYAPVVRSDVVVSAGKPVELTIVLTGIVSRLVGIDVKPTFFPTVPSASATVSTQSFSAEEVRRFPGVQEDVVRAIATLPGVGVTTAGRNDLVVRGGAPFENLFVVDNIEVPNINHFGTQGSTGGPISLINIDFVQDASLSAGGFGVRYGDKTASVTTISLREGTRERVSSELNLSATGAGAILEGPLPGGGSFLASVRRSYLDLIFEAAGFSFIPAYTDLTLKTVWRPTPRDQLSFLTIGAIATISFNNSTADNRFENSRVASPSQDQYFSGLTWRRTLRRGLITTTLGRTWTQFTTVQRDSGSATRPPAPVFIANTTEGETSLRSDLTMTRGGIEFEAGNILKVASALDYRLLVPGDLRRDAAGIPRGLDTDTSFVGVRNASYLQGTWQLSDRVRATVGGRADYYAFLQNAVRLAPRATISWAIDPTTTASLAGGRYWQAPQLIWLAGDPTNRDRLRPFRADQVVASLSRTVRPDTKVQIEAYAKRYGDFPGRVFRPSAVLQPSGFDDATNDIPFGLEPLESSARGTVIGAEALVQKKLSEVPVYGLLSLSYNRSRFTSLAGRTVVGAFDTPVILNGLLGWRPNARWELSSRARAAAGLPTTPFSTTGANAGRLDFTRYNAGDRLPTFFSLDVRVDRRFTIRGTQLITYLDVQNATRRKNVSQVNWNARLGTTERQESIGILPSIGINWEF
jgi:hypothetical protein